MNEYAGDTMEPGVVDDPMLVGADSAAGPESARRYAGGGRTSRSGADAGWRSSANHELGDGWSLQPTGLARNTRAEEDAESPGLLGDARVLIVDDCTLFREYLAGVIAANGGVPPLMAWDLSSLINAIEDAPPRVILMNMATREHPMLLRQALRMSPHVQVVAMGMSEDDEAAIVACAEAGVAGYHMRNESLADLLLLIRKVAVGESMCSPRVSAILLRRLSALAAARQTGPRDPDLTERESQILRMLELGRSNREIADELCTRCTRSRITCTAC